MVLIADDLDFIPLSLIPGVLGKRTYFQESKAQLALQVTDNTSPPPTANCPREDNPAVPPQGEYSVVPREDTEDHEDTSEPAPCPRLPSDLRLGDDTRRERIQYDDPALETGQSPLRQAAILAKL